MLDPARRQDRVQHGESASEKAHPASTSVASRVFAGGGRGACRAATRAQPSRNSSQRCSIIARAPAARRGGALAEERLAGGEVEVPGRTKRSSDQPGDVVQARVEALAPRWERRRVWSISPRCRRARAATPPPRPGEAPSEGIRQPGEDGARSSRRSRGSGGTARPGPGSSGCTPARRVPRRRSRRRRRAYWPLADRLEHLDRRDLRVGAVELPEVALDDLDAIAEPRGGDALRASRAWEGEIVTALSTARRTRRPP